MNKSTDIEIQKKHWRSIIAEALDEIKELQEQLPTDLTEKNDVAKILIEDLKMIKAEATVELLRIRISEGYELSKEEKEEEIEIEDDD